MGTIGQWNYFKVKAEGRMYSSSVKSTCERNGMVNTCVGDRSCQFTTSDCTVTDLTGCGNPMIDISRKYCNGGYPSRCPRLDGVSRTWGHGLQEVLVGYSVAHIVQVEIVTATNGHSVQNVLIKSINSSLM